MTNKAAHPIRSLAPSDLRRARGGADEAQVRIVTKLYVVHPGVVAQYP